MSGRSASDGRIGYDLHASYPHSARLQSAAGRRMIRAGGARYNSIWRHLTSGSDPRLGLASS